jgi:hypothetical protein
MDPNELKSITDTLRFSLGGTSADMTNFLQEMKKAPELTVAAENADNAGRVLGMDTEELSYQNSMLALTDPKLYAKSRLEAYTAIKTIETAFKRRVS